MIHDWCSIYCMLQILFVPRPLIISTILVIIIFYSWGVVKDEFTNVDYPMAIIPSIK